MFKFKFSFFYKALFSSLFVLALFAIGKPAAAATSTICGSGCTYTTIGAAIADIGSENVFAVGSTYSAFSETFPVSLPTGKTIDCESSDAIIGNPNLMGVGIFTLAATTTIRNCIFGNIELQTGDLNPWDIQILNNAFSTMVTSTITFPSGANNFLIDGNTNVGTVDIENGTALSSGIIRNNSFYTSRLQAHSGSILNIPEQSTGIQIISNQFDNWATNDVSEVAYIVLLGYDVTFASNTLRDWSSTGLQPNASVLVQASGTTIFSGNRIDGTPTTGCKTVQFTAAGATSNAVQVGYITHNTLRIPAECVNGVGLQLADEGNDAANMTMDVSYNLTYNLGSSAGATGFLVSRDSTINTFALTSDYMASYNFADGYAAPENGYSSSVIGSHFYTGNPFLRLANASTADDFELASFSPYLDINGSLDIGAVEGVRSATINLDAVGTINYSSVHGTSTYEIADALRSGDTLNLADGTYMPITVSSTNATTSIAISGTGSSAIIDGNRNINADGILLTNVTSSVISNITIQNASTTWHEYTANLAGMSFGGTTYDTALDPLGAPASSTLVLTGACDPSTLVPFTSNGYTITSYVGLATDNWHIALISINMGGPIMYSTVLVPGSLYSNTGSFAAACGFLTVDAFIQNAFTVSSGVFTYNAAAVASSSSAPLPWVGTPALNTINNGLRGGVRLVGSHGIAISSVTTTNNGNGIIFGSGSGENTVTDSTLQGDTAYDINHQSTLRNTFDNVTFSRASSVFSSSGDLLVKFKTRAYVTRLGSGTALADVNVSSTSALATITPFGTTDASGYTSYVSLPAYLMSASSIATTNGGYNPYVFQAVTSTYVTSSTSQSLTSRNATYSIAMYSSAGPTTPTFAAATDVSTATASLVWTDNSDDEDSFWVEYRRPLQGESYPGTAILVSGATSTGLTGLTPGEQYEFRVAAVNTIATSTYATSSVFTTTPAIDAPTVSALSGTSFSAVINTNGNATSVNYALYSSSLSGYLDSLGAVATTPVWQTSSTWSTLTVSGLTCATAYSVVAIARNTASAESATSSAATVTTSACPAVTTNTGGGGAVSGGGGGAIQTFFTPTPVIVAPVTPLVPSLPPAPVQKPVIETSIASRERIATIARSFGFSLGEEVKDRLAIFLQEGTSEASKKLGQGERDAVLRDAIETMQRIDIPTDDLERIAVGEIPKTRSLVYERTLAPRALATFRQLFGHVPNFKNASENLAWNTMMYRLRFPRDLPKERQGITAFRSTFKKIPTDPFQWAVVRVMGYVRSSETR